MQNNEGKLITERPFLHMPSPMIAAKVTVDNEFDARRMERAIEKLTQAHPLLQCKVANMDDGSTCFVKEENHYTWGYEKNSDWISVLGKILDVPMDLSQNAPLRVSVVDHESCFDLILVCHHAICDGMALTALMKDLLALYCSEETVARKDSIRISDHNDFPVSNRFTAEFREKLEGLNEEWKKAHGDFDLDPEKYASMCHAHTGSVGFDIVMVRLDEKETKALKDACKGSGVTVNSAVSTAILYALAADGQNQKATIAVDVRDRIGNVSGGMSDYSSCIAPIIRYDKEIGFWENVKLHHEIFLSELKDTNKLLYTLQLFSILDGRMFDATYAARYGYFTDFAFLKQFRDVLNFGSDENGFDLSNLGSVNIPATYADCSVHDFTFVPNLTMICDFTFGVATMDGVMNLSICYKDKHVNREEAERVADAIRYCLI